MVGLVAGTIWLKATAGGSNGRTGAVEAGGRKQTGRQAKYLNFIRWSVKPRASGGDMSDLAGSLLSATTERPSNTAPSNRAVAV
jgi:hypothetical protein